MFVYQMVITSTVHVPVLQLLHRERITFQNRSNSSILGKILAAVGSVKQQNPTLFQAFNDSKNEVKHVSDTFNKNSMAGEDLPANDDFQKTFKNGYQVTIAKA